MWISRLQLENWRNFKSADVALARRTFIVGNNGLGKSNLLDALRFLRDIAKEQGGGLQDALARRGGIGHVRSLSARQRPHVTIAADINDDDETTPAAWRYELALEQERHGAHRLLVKSEVVEKNGETILNRPDDKDKEDSENLTQTALEQISANKAFRALAGFFKSFCYLHMVPQLIRHAHDFNGKILSDDPFGQGLLGKMAELPEKTRQSRLRRIMEAIQNIKPEFSDFVFMRDEKTGQPHLRYRHKSWRREGSFQNEQQLSDGELRFIGLVWTLLESNDVTMLEEPELSFNEGIVRELPGIFAKAVLSRKKGGSRQIIMTTHSSALLQDEGIDDNEIVVLMKRRNEEATEAKRASDIPEIRGEMAARLSAAEAVLGYAQTPPGQAQLPFQL